MKSAVIISGEHWLTINTIAYLRGSITPIEPVTYNDGRQGVKISSSINPLVIAVEGSTIDGAEVGSQTELISFLRDFAYANSGGGSSTGIQSIVPGNNIEVDDTDPNNPVISTSAQAIGASEAYVNNRVASVYSDQKSIPLGNIIDGRYTSATNTTIDANNSFKIMEGFLEVQPFWKLYSNNAQSASSFNWQFDQFMQPLTSTVPVSEVVNGVTMYRYPLHPKVKFIRLSGNNANMQAKTLTVTNGISNSLSSSITDKDNASTLAYSDNQFNYDEILPNMYVPPASTDGSLVVLNNMRSTPMIRLKKNTGSLVTLNIPSNSNSSGIAFYRQDGSFIRNFHITNSLLELNGLNGGFFYKVPITDADAYYYRYWFDQRLYQSSVDQMRRISLVYSGSESAATIGNTFFGKPLQSEDVRRIIRSERKVKKDFSDLCVLILGDSNTENSGGRGSWNNAFLRLMRPGVVRNRAVAGATVTSTEDLFGVGYATGANTLLRQCEIEIQAFNANPTTFRKPDIIIITGGTNDFDLNRFVTPSTIATFPDYHEAMEATFVSDSPSFNAKKDLQTIDRGKVGGAIRYMHERFLNTFPEAIQFVITPLRSTLHNQVSAKRLVNEMSWMAQRWQLPVIDVFNHGGISTVRDFGTDRFNLSDRVHVFSQEGQTVGADKYGMYIVNEIYNKYNTLTIS